MPERTCMCCRKKGNKEEFFRISKQDEKFIFDENYKVQSRGFYICKTLQCLEKLSKHKKISLDINELIKMANMLSKNKSDILDILRSMKMSGNLIFGLDENIESIKKEKVKIVIIPKDINEKYKKNIENLKLSYNFEILYIETQTDFINIFSKDVKIVGIHGKSVVRGILKKMEVTHESTRIS